MLGIQYSSGHSIKANGDLLYIMVTTATWGAPHAFHGRGYRSELISTSSRCDIVQTAYPPFQPRTRKSMD